MNVIGYTESGSIRVILDGDESESIVPDDMGNRHRFMIWDEWEMAPPDPETGERERVNTIPPYVPPPPPPPAPYLLRMSDFWDRFTDDDEYNTFVDALDVATPAKTRRALNSATELLSNSELFAWTKTLLTTATSAGRAAAIMAASPSHAGRPADEDAA